MNTFRRGFFLVLSALWAGFVLQGCSYFQNRWNDAGDMIDLGVTWSPKPQFALYYDFVPLIPIGYGHVEGCFAGLGGGSGRWNSPHVQRSYGAMLWGQEELTFDTSRESLDAMSEAERDAILDFQRSGLIGMVQGPFPGPHYLISCPHYVHLGWVGVVATPRYLQMLDFLVGWSTLDICDDD